jgi:hypothetical protein
MKRRQFLQSLALSAGAGLFGGPVNRLYAAPAEYDGRLLLVLQAEGGWDVTSLCDPKTNTAGEPEINQWARSADIQTAGHIQYAPFANNADLFGKYHQDMLVINGVDAQTNSHTTGVMHNWSGRNAAGYPTLTAMFSAHQAPDLPLAYINFGGFAEAGRLIRYNRLDDVYALYDILQPNIDTWSNTPIRLESEMSRIAAAQQASLERKLASGTLTPRQRDNIDAYMNARSTAAALSRFVDVLPASAEDFQEPFQIHPNLGETDILRQIQLAILAFEAGVSSAADLILFGHDTHTNHDEQHTALFGALEQAVDYLWTYAETRGVADRLTLVIGSDFGRTPHYNADNGKDHWPIGSYIVMEKGAPWGNRQVGLTDAVHNAHRINPATLQRDDGNGTIIYPKHVHKALRRHLGIENTAVDANFLFGNTEDFDFFNPGLTT